MVLSHTIETDGRLPHNRNRWPHNSRATAFCHAWPILLFAPDAAFYPLLTLRHTSRDPPPKVRHTSRTPRFLEGLVQKNPGQKPPCTNSVSIVRGIFVRGVCQRVFCLEGFVWGGFCPFPFCQNTSVTTES